MTSYADRLSPVLALQLAALLPLAICAYGLFGDAELTPRWSLGLLTYGAVALSYCAGTLNLRGPARLLPLLVPVAAWLAQLLDMQWGLAMLALVALLIGIFPVSANRYRLFGLGAAALLAVSAVKIHSYGFY